MTLQTITTDYLFTGSASPLVNSAITFDEHGKIQSIGEATTAPPEATHYPGAICPGFINAHIHTELSHLKAVQDSGSGMAQFIKSLSVLRHRTPEPERKISIAGALTALYQEGMSGAGDICNEQVSFSPKKQNRIRWHHFIEVFGTQSINANKIDQIAKQLLHQSISEGFQASLTPHSTYSLSQDLFSLIQRHLIATGACLSVHFMESCDEIDLLHKRSGPLAELFESWGLSAEYIPETIRSAAEQLISNLPPDNRIMFVHNTFINQPTINRLQQHFTDPWFCLCPSSNLSITQTLPPVLTLRNHPVQLLIGTDSTASNPKLSMVEEIRILHQSFPGIPLHEIIGWGTINGAKFFGWDDLGSIEPGKTPGLVWLKNFSNPEDVLPESVVGIRIV